MKKIFFVVLLGLSGLDAISQQKKFTDLLGRWEFVGEQNRGACLEIIDSSNIILSYNGEKKKISYYQIDFAKSPIWFDFSTEDSASTVSVKSIMEIMNGNMIKWQLFIDEDRPNYFSSSKGELLYLKKSASTINTGVAVNSQ